MLGRILVAGRHTGGAQIRARGAPGFILHGSVRRSQPVQRWLHQCKSLQHQARAMGSVALTSQDSSAPVFHAGGQFPRVAELAEIPGMKSSDLRRLSEAAAAEGADAEVWEAIAVRCDAFADQMRYWDVIHVLQAFTRAGVANRQLFLRLGEALSAKTSKFAPKHIMDIFAVYEAHSLRPRALYVELLHVTIRLSKSMYAEEVSLMLQLFARHRIGNPTVVAHLVSAVVRQLPEFRLRYLCGVTGALGALQMTPEPLLEELYKHACFEVQTIAVQELLDNLQAFPLLEYSWKPFEDLCLKEFGERVRGFQVAADVAQLADPFGALLFLQARGLLERGFLEALTQWCLAGVHRPNVLSERRPTSRQLLLLHDRCHEFGLESAPALQDTISYYVESGGGQWPKALPKPLQWCDKRRFRVREDPIEAEIPQVTSASLLSRPSRQTSPRAQIEDLPGLPSSAPETSLWQTAGDDMEEADSQGTSEEIPRPKKKCGGQTVMAFITSRRGPRPRHVRDPGLHRYKRKNWPRTAVWFMKAFCNRKKYIY